MVRKASGAEAAPRRRHRTALQLHSALGGARRGRAAAPPPTPPPTARPAASPQLAAAQAQAHRRLPCGPGGASSCTARASPRACARAPARPMRAAVRDGPCRTPRHYPGCSPGPIPTRGLPATHSPGETVGRGRQSWQAAVRSVRREDPACSGPGMGPTGGRWGLQRLSPKQFHKRSPIANFVRERLRGHAWPGAARRHAAQHCAWAGHLAAADPGPRRGAAAGGDRAGCGPAC